MKTNKEIIQLLTANTHLAENPSFAFDYKIHENVTKANMWALKTIKPQDWSLLYDGTKFMTARDKDVKTIIAKYPGWKLVGAYDSEAYIKKTLIDIRNLSKSDKAKTSRELAQLLAADFSSPKFDEPFVKAVQKKLKELKPQLMKVTGGDKMNFTKFSIPKYDGEVRVAVIVDPGANEDAGSINTAVRANGAGLVSDKDMYAFVQPLKPSQRMGGEFYLLTVTIFKNQ